MYLYIIFCFFTLLALGEVVFNGIEYRKTTIYKLIFGFVLVCLFLLSSLRWETGTDWTPYYDFFLAQKQITFISWLEPGYTFLCSLCYVISGGHYSVFLAVIATIILYLKSSMIKKYSIYPFFTILVWWTIYLADIFPVRQTIAIGFTLYAIRYVIEKKKWKFVLFVCCAATFHLSALIFLPAYYLFSLKTKRIILILSLLGSYLLAYLSTSFAHSFLSLIGFDFIQERLQSYMSDGDDQTYGGLYTAAQILFRGLINKVIIFIPVFTYLWKYVEKDSLLRGWINLIFWGTILATSITSISPALSRLGIYYDVAIQIFLIPYFIKIKMPQFSKFLVFLFIIAYLFYRFNGVVVNYESEYIPYISIFS